MAAEKTFTIELRTKDDKFIDKIKLLIVNNKPVVVVWRVCTYKEVEKDFFKPTKDGFIRAEEILKAVKELAKDEGWGEPELILMLPKDVAEDGLKSETILKKWVDESRLKIQPYANTLKEFEEAAKKLAK